MFKTLTDLGRKFNDSNITWAVGASMMLSQYGLANKPNDIDIFVDVKDIDLADEILKNMGDKKKWGKTATYSTKYFYEYVIDGIDIDVMAGFAINHSHGIYEYIFDNKAISEVKRIDGVDIPFTSLEDWWIIYQLIPNREAKVNIIEKHLLSKGIKNPALLQRALEGNLSSEARKNTRNLLGAFS